MTLTSYDFCDTCVRQIAATHLPRLGQRYELRDEQSLLIIPLRACFPAAYVEAALCDSCSAGRGVLGQSTKRWIPNLQSQVH